MDLETLSSIKGARSSEAIESLFGVIKEAQSGIDEEVKNSQGDNTITLDQLRDDIIMDSSDSERSNIIENFPRKKKNYLVVSKVIEE